MYDCITIGGATADFFAKSNSFSITPDFLQIPISSKSEINNGVICSGGGATNAAVSMSRLGLKTTCVSLVGNDILRKFILNDFKKNNVDSSFLIKEKGGVTDYSIVLVSPEGSRSILTNRGETSLKEENINWDLIKDTKWFYITSLEGNLDLLEKIIGFAKENNIKVAFNPGNRELKKIKQLLPLLKHLDFLLLNQTESEALTQLDHSHPEFFNRLHTFGNTITAITNGRQGAHIFCPQGDYFSPIINTEPVDETGAGDAFGSTFVAATIIGLEAQDALFWSIKNSASVVSFLGAKEGLLHLEEIKG